MIFYLNKLCRDIRFKRIILSFILIDVWMITKAMLIVRISIIEASNYRYVAYCAKSDEGVLTLRDSSIEIESNQCLDNWKHY